MEITEVKVRLWDDKRLRALVTIVFEDCFVVRNIKVIEGRDDKLFVAMPSRRLPDGTYSDIAHPITRDFRRQVESTIIDAFLEEQRLSKDDPNYSRRRGRGRVEEDAHHDLGDSSYSRR